MASFFILCLHYSDFTLTNIFIQIVMTLNFKNTWDAFSFFFYISTARKGYDTLNEVEVSWGFRNLALLLNFERYFHWHELVSSSPQNQDFYSLWMKTTWQNNQGYATTGVPCNYKTIKMCKLSVWGSKMKIALTGRNVLASVAR